MKTPEEIGREIASNLIPRRGWAKEDYDYTVERIASVTSAAIAHDRQLTRNTALEEAAAACIAVFTNPSWKEAYRSAAAMCATAIRKRMKGRSGDVERPPELTEPGMPHITWLERPDPEARRHEEKAA